jgi:hypothetical protein
MCRHPIFDLVTGMTLALGGPLALMLPQRLFLEMISGGFLPRDEPAPAEESRRTAV